MTEQEFVDAMMLYKTGRRKNKVMVSVTGSLDATQIQALAIYFTSQTKQ
jgi:cytochrome c553